MTELVSVEEIENALLELEDGVRSALESTGAVYMDGRWMSWDKTPCPGSAVDALKNEVVKSHELVRVRQHIWRTSDLSDDSKWRLTTILNLVARFINVITVRGGTDERLSEIAKKLEDNLYYFIAGGYDVG